MFFLLLILHGQVDLGSTLEDLIDLGSKEYSGFPHPASVLLAPPPFGRGPKEMTCPMIQFLRGPALHQGSTVVLEPSCTFQGSKKMPMKR